MTTTRTLTAALREFADHEFKALVTIETAERLAVKAHLAIESGDLDEAKRLLAALTSETTTRTATAVKDQQVSDAIATQSARRVAAVMAQRPIAVDRDDENATEHAARHRSGRPGDPAHPDWIQHGLIGRPDRPGGV